MVRGQQQAAARALEGRMSSLASALERMGLQNDDELELEVQDSVFTPAQVWCKGPAQGQLVARSRSRDLSALSAVCSHQNHRMRLSGQQMPRQPWHHSQSVTTKHFDRRPKRAMQLRKLPVRHQLTT